MANPECRGHVPVMQEEVLQLLACRSGGLYVDGTAGGGGYAEAILQRTGPNGVLLALDWDAAAIERVAERLRPYGERVHLERASFADLPLVLEGRGLGPVDGVVIDLGISSFQLEDPHRGFSFLHDGPLDMRMDQDLSQTAADLVNTMAEGELADLIFNFGEEKWARRIARAIVERRKRRPITGTLEIAGLVAEATPKTRDSRRIHPATRTFQALRIAVNRELEALSRFLARILDVLKSGGRLCVVSFHSLEDRVVKDQFRTWARSCRCPQSTPVCLCGGQPLVELLTRKPLRPTAAEVERNPRARSARLRAISKL